MSSTSAPQATNRRRAIGFRSVLFVVDREQSTLDRLVSDLRRRFGDDFTVVGETSQREGLDALEAMAEDGESVALLLVAETASEFLERAHELHPWAKRVLLVDR